MSNARSDFSPARTHRAVFGVLLSLCAWSACADQPTTYGQGDGPTGDGDRDQADEGDGDEADDEDEGDGDGDDSDEDTEDEQDDLGPDGGAGNGNGCMLGEAGSFATDQSLNLFGDVVYFAKGKSLPAGRYRVAYEDGCMKYNFLFAWSVNSHAGSDGWWLVGETSQDRVVVLPGKADSAVDFSECVASNKQLPAKEFDFPGGKLGIWLNDTPYQDNISGEGGRNPKWKLTLLVDECPPDLVLL